MIFLTVGTTKFLFPRILQAIDQALILSGTKEKLIAQIGPNKYRFAFKYVKQYHSPQNILDYLKALDIQ